MKRPIEEKAMIRIGGVIVAKFKHFVDELLVILVVRSGDNFYGVMAKGRQAHRAYRLEDGLPVEIKGTLVETTLPSEKGWKPVLSILCEKLRAGSQLQKVSNPFGDFYKIPSGQLFEKIRALNCAASSN